MEAIHFPCPVCLASATNRCSEGGRQSSLMLHVARFKLAEAFNEVRKESLDVIRQDQPNRVKEALKGSDGTDSLRITNIAEDQSPYLFFKFRLSDGGRIHIAPDQVMSMWNAEHEQKAAASDRDSLLSIIRERNERIYKLEASIRKWQGTWASLKASVRALDETLSGTDSREVPDSKLTGKEGE